MFYIFSPARVNWQVFSCAIWKPVAGQNRKRSQQIGVNLSKRRSNTATSKQQCYLRVVLWVGEFAGAVKTCSLYSFPVPVILPCCAGLFHNEDAVVHVISQKMQFWITVPRAFTPTLADSWEPSQATEEISQQTRSDKLWNQLIFSDTWHWDPLTSTQHTQHTVNGGEHRAKTPNKEAQSAAMIRQCKVIWEPDYSGNEVGNVTNEDINKRVLRCPFSL